MDHESDLAKTTAAALPIAASGANLSEYLSEVEAHFDSEQAAMEFLRTLWDIMCAFVDLGWGVDSIHFAFPELAQISSEESQDAPSSPDQHIEEEFTAATHAPPESESP